MSKFVSNNFYFYLENDIIHCSSYVKNFCIIEKYIQTPIIVPKTIPETDFRDLLLRKELPRKKGRKHEAVIRYDGYVIETPFLLLQSS